MRTSSPWRTLCLVMLVMLIGCSETAEPPQATVRPVKTFIVNTNASDALRTFPGRVEATQRAELSFRVPGTLQAVLVREGDRVGQGQVLARLDPTDYEIVLEDRQAAYDNAERNYRRGQELVASGNISRVEFDRMETQYRSTRAALSKARQDLEYTALKSPFAGRVAQRLVENFEEVSASQPVLILQNVDTVDVVIDLPEGLVRRARRQTGRDQPAGDVRNQRIVAEARFEGHPDSRFPLRIKEVATKANEQTQTFRATLTMDSPEAFNVLPGMSAQVMLDLSDLMPQDPTSWVPVRAVQGDSELSPRVWVLDPGSMTVNSRAVEVGRMSGDRIEVTDGLIGGEEIVAVGAPYLAEGMSVTRMPSSEQAVPREEESR